MWIRWMGVLAWVASMSLVGVVFVPSVLSWTGLGWVSVLGFLVLLAAVTVATRSPRSVAQVIAATEAEPGPAVASWGHTSSGSPDQAHEAKGEEAS